MLGAGLIAGNLLPGCKTAFASRKTWNNFGLQLYTLRDVLPADPKGIITQVASFGYKEIESYEGPQGMFWGMKNTGFRQLLDDLGMRVVASHCNVEKDFDRKVEEAAEIGIRYLICPWLGPQPKLDDYKAAAERFNRYGETCKKHGLRFAYHNHDYSFVPVEGQVPQDVLIQHTDKELVDFEMDIYWVVTAGQDPLAWFEKYPDRFRLCHIKDRKKAAEASDKDASTTLGKGSIAFSSVLRSAASHGMKHFIVEQERYDDTTPLDAVKDNAAYLKNLV